MNTKDDAEMAWVPGGTFWMGADKEDLEHTWSVFGWKKEWLNAHLKQEAPRREVRVDGYWMYKHEVTVGQFAQFVAATGHKTEAEENGASWHFDPDSGKLAQVTQLSWRRPLPDGGGEATPDHPVVHVTWQDAQAYCRWAGVRLPSEAEWEYAVRGGPAGCNGRSGRVFAWGDQAPKALVANVADKSFKGCLGVADRAAFAGYADGYVLTAPVGSFQPNALGIHDLTGNVWEWCADRYGVGSYASVSGPSTQVPAAGQHRVLRGGSWGSDVAYCRLSARGGLSPSRHSSGIGFRPCMSPSVLQTAAADMGPNPR